MLNLEQKWYFAQCGANDPQAWNIEFPDSLQLDVYKRQDPDRVASIVLLKDAAATAIYGSRAANGVIVIESRCV